LRELARPGGAAEQQVRRGPAPGVVEPDRSRETALAAERTRTAPVGERAPVQV
jgi:hypothetical protein